MQNNDTEMSAEADAPESCRLAVAGIIDAMTPISGADRIQLASVNCGEAGVWSGVVAKDMAVGQPVIVFLQDAILQPGDDRWAFMEKHRWRVRMARFKGAASECVIVPSDALLEPGADLSLELGVTKHSKPVPAEMAGVARGNFPSFLPKTDEENFQRVLARDLLMANSAWYVTEKADGTSCTAYKVDCELRVCSRNLELIDGDNLYWQAARKYGLSLLPNNTALQFEIVGPSIQGNPMGLEQVEIRVFAVYVFGSGPTRRLPYEDLLMLCQEMSLPMAKLVLVGEGALDADAIRKMAEITYPNGQPGEGVVLRSLDSTWSFKAINLLYKD